MKQRNAGVGKLSSRRAAVGSWLAAAVAVLIVAGWLTAGILTNDTRLLLVSATVGFTLLLAGAGLRWLAQVRDAVARVAGATSQVRASVDRLDDIVRNLEEGAAAGRQASVESLSGIADASAVSREMLVSLESELGAVRLSIDAIRKSRSADPWSERKVDRILERLGDSPRGIEDRLRRSNARDVSALLALHSLIDVVAEVPSPSGWAATPQTILVMVDAVRSLPDNSVVVECGSGTSSVWLGLAAKQQGRGIRVISLEHQLEFADQTRAALHRNGLDNEVDVRVAPLTETVIEGEPYSWYSADVLDGVDRVAMLFVDGPPGKTGSHARFPAFPMLRDRLIDGCVLILDDTNRSDERDILARWRVAEGRGRLVEDRELDRASVLRFELSRNG